MVTVGVDGDLLRELLRQRDELVRSITAGMSSGNWDPVMGAFDGLLVVIARLEDTLSGADVSSPR